MKKRGASLFVGSSPLILRRALLDLDDLVFVFALFTGLRPKEYLGLPLSNVERVSDSHALVRVTQQAVKPRGGPHVFTRPKTKTGVREVPFPLWLYRELLRLKAANEARTVLMGHARESFNFGTYTHALPRMFEGVSETLERQILGEARTRRVGAGHVTGRIT
jgi:integrase